jgi:hypothetical protein
LWIDRWLMEPSWRVRLMRWAVAVAMAWTTVPLINWVLDGRPYLSRAGHAFLMGRMIDMGMLRAYLDEHCPEERYVICAFRNDMPRDGQVFLWSELSPLAKQGGDATRDEYGRIVRGSLTEPKYILWHARGSIAATAGLLCEWDVGNGFRSGWYSTPESPPHAMIEELMPGQLQAYLGSLQNGGRGELDMRWPDRMHAWVLGLSLGGALLLLRRQRVQARGQAGTPLVLFAIATIVIDAWVCATLSTVDSRFLGRVAWLLPFAVLTALASRVQGRMMRVRAGAAGRIYPDGIQGR